MKPVDILIIAVIAAVLLLAAWYVYKSKKSGKKCIGCPGGCCPTKNGGACGGNCTGCSCGK